jgi:hypothetical protein
MRLSSGNYHRAENNGNERHDDQQCAKTESISQPWDDSDNEAYYKKEPMRRIDTQAFEFVFPVKCLIP